MSDTLDTSQLTGGKSPLGVRQMFLVANLLDNISNQ